MAADGENKRSTSPKTIVRWLFAIGMAAFAIAVVAVAVVIMLQPEDLQLSINHGSVTVYHIQSLPPQKMTFSLTLLIHRSPRGSASILYRNTVNVRFLFGTSSSPVEANSSVNHFFSPERATQGVTTVLTVRSPDDLSRIPYQQLSRGCRIPATVQVEIFLLYNARHRNVTYWCSGVTVGYNKLHNSDDVSCTEMPHGSKATPPQADVPSGQQPTCAGGCSPPVAPNASDCSRGRPENLPPVPAPAPHPQE